MSDAAHGTVETGIRSTVAAQQSPSTWKRSVIPAQLTNIAQPDEKCVKNAHQTEQLPNTLMPSEVSSNKDNAPVTAAPTTPQSMEKPSQAKAGTRSPANDTGITSETTER